MTKFNMCNHFLTRKEGKLTPDEVRMLKENEWLKFLYFKKNTDDINIESFNKIEEITPLATLEYVYRTLVILEGETNNLNDIEKRVLETVLCYCEVAKGGTSAIRKRWRENHYPLSIHNLGSAFIFTEVMESKLESDELNYISTLISTHGLIGQYLRGETSLKSSEALIDLRLSGVDHEKVVKVLNKCVIGGVSMELYERIKPEVDSTIEKLLKRNYNRLKRLRSKAIANGEDFDKEYLDFCNKYPTCLPALNDFLNRFNLWYVEAATSDFKLVETLKLFVYIDRQIDNIDPSITDVSFKSMMSFYCDYQNQKVINVFKERVIEKLLNEYDVTDELVEELQNEHVEIVLDYTQETLMSSFLNVKIQFSTISEKFIDFCIAAIGQGALYDKVITMACDHFGIRRDKYDRFYNEYEYLQTMNSTTELKKVLVDYIEGDTIIDVGPGGGGLMDAILDKFPEKQVTGIDVSENVIDKLTKIKNIYNKKWGIMKGNALELGETFKQGDFDTIIFCSILHELFSYIPYEGKKFNYNTLKKVFKSVYSILPKGGRLIIRDGIMSEDNSDRIIRFKDSSDIKILERYAKDFKGREICFKKISDDSVIMPANDAMEFLYTYTWGEDSYAHEINEQFGYFTPNEYENFVKECFWGKCNIVYSKAFLQEGYSEHLLKKVDYYDAFNNTIDLPNSTFILVVEKI